jgi:hypothetical protein
MDDRNIPEGCLLLGVLNEDRFEGVAGDVADAIRTDSDGDKLEFFNVLQAAFLEGWARN